MAAPFAYGSDRLTPEIALALAKGEREGKLTSAVRERLAGAHAQVVAIAAGDSASYGINTGFGPLCSTIIAKADRARLQEKLLKSHSVGVGPAIDPLVSRLMLVGKVHGLCQGASGIAPAIIDRLLWHLDTGYTPVVPSQGSVGASGDLAPLSHLFLPLIGEGYVTVFGASSRATSRESSTTPTPAATVLREHALEPLHLGPKAGLALINGTQFIAAHAVLATVRLKRCLAQANLIGAMMVDALQGSHAPFDARLHALRPHAGAVAVASSLRQNLRGSTVPAAHADCDRVQDPYSLRCMPQVHGASADAIAHLESALSVELNAVTDNPVLVGREEVISGGSFHGQPLALPIDYACLAAAELGSISERRTYLSLLGEHPNGHRLLMENAGLDSGFMIVQYTAAALVSENKTQCFPAAADSIPTGMGQEDHVSMGAHGARKLLRVVDNLERILGIELLCAAQALDFQRPLRSGAAVEALHARVRAAVPHATADEVFAPWIERCAELVRG